VVDGGPPPDGAKSGAAASLTEWLVTLSAGGGVFVTVIGTLKEWLTRRGAAHKLTVTIDGDTLELSNATQTERAEVIETFVRRHQPT
jgi:Effector Associated Constant Component 1